MSVLLLAVLLAVLVGLIIVEAIELARQAAGRAQLRVMRSAGRGRVG